MTNTEQRSGRNEKWFGDVVTPEMIEADEENYELWDADPACAHNVDNAPRGDGIKCTECTGWFCY